MLAVELFELVPNIRNALILWRRLIYITIVPILHELERLSFILLGYKQKQEQSSPRSKNIQHTQAPRPSVLFVTQ